MPWSMEIFLVPLVVGCCTFIHVLFRFCFHHGFVVVQIFVQLSLFLYARAVEISVNPVLSVNSFYYHLHTLIAWSFMISSKTIFRNDLIKPVIIVHLSSKQSHQRFCVFNVWFNAFGSCGCNVSFLLCSTYIHQRAYRYDYGARNQKED